MAMINKLLQGNNVKYDYCQPQEILYNQKWVHVHDYLKKYALLVSFVKQKKTYNLYTLLNKFNYLRQSNM